MWNKMHKTIVIFLKLGLKLDYMLKSTELFHDLSESILYSGI